LTKTQKYLCSVLQLKWVKIQNKGTGQNFQVAPLQENFVKL